MKMRRIDIIKNIMDNVTDEIVISSTGKISREVYSVNDRPLNFYVQGSMSATLGIALGIAINKPRSNIIAIIGDGEALMSLGTLVVLNKLRKDSNIKNVELYIDEGEWFINSFLKHNIKAITFTKKD